MASTKDKAECVKTCWSIAAVAGLVAAVLFFFGFDFGAVKAILVGLVVALGCGVLLSKFACASTPETSSEVPAKAATTAPQTAVLETEGEAAKEATAAAETGTATIETTPQVAVSSEGNPDWVLDAPRPEGKDDLKRISGVGPKLEETLNSLGIFHFDQIAGFQPEDIAWVDARVRFKGRIARDDWMGQAAILTKGGETEFSTKKKS